MEVTEKKLRKLIRETLLTEKCWDGYRPGAQSGVKTKISSKTGKRVANCEKIKEDDEVIGEADMTTSIRTQRRELIEREYEKVDSSVRYPYGRHRGDVRSTLAYVRKDKKPVPPEDLKIFRDLEDEQRKDAYAALGGIFTHSVSDDGMTLNVKYYKHTSD